MNFITGEENDNGMMTKNPHGSLFCKHAESLLPNITTLNEVYVIQHEVEIITRKSVREYFYILPFWKCHLAILWKNVS